jgi:dTMP kinase
VAKGLFITFEGGEGAGKTTQLRLLKEKLEKAGRTVLATREPGGTPGAEAIRKLLVNGDAYEWNAETEVLLHFAARCDHVEKLINPGLEEGSIVISDRFYDSTYAYQGYGQGFDLKKLDAVRTTMIGDIKPDITFLLDLPVDIGMKRVTEQQRYERLPVEFHEKLRQGFLTLAKAEPNRIKTVDATQSAENVAAAVWAEVQKKL